MTANQFIFLLSASVFLAAYGLWQVALHWVERDRAKLAQRLGADTGARLEQLEHRSLTLDRGEASPKLARSRILQAINRRLQCASPGASLGRFLAISGLIGFILFVSVAGATNSLLVGLAAGAGGAYGPMMLLDRRRIGRRKALEEQLPDALDFLSRILRAGHSLSTGIEMMSEELPQPVAGEFRRCYDQHSLGRSLEDALRELSASIDSTDYAFFVTAVLIQRQTGGDLSQVLTNISAMVRARIRLQRHVKAITAEGRLTGMILFAFPAALFVISYALNPNYTGVLLKTDTGQAMLGGAVLMQLIGLYFIRRIVNVRV